MSKKKSKRKAQKRCLKIATIVIYAILIAIAAFFIITGVVTTPEAPPVPTLSPTPVPTATPAPTPVPTATPSPTPVPTPKVFDGLSLANREDTILISACGDCTLGGVHKSSTADKFRSYAKTQGFGYFMENVKDIFSKDDLTIANLEVVLTNNGTPREGRQYIMHGYQEYVNILTEGSIEAANIANNHAKDFGSNGLKRTKSVLEEAGIASCGYDSYAILDIKGIKVGLLAYTVWDNDYDQMRKDVKKMQSYADLIIVSIHGGEEKEYTPTKDQIKYCRAAVDAGADLVLGHHPHVINGIETYKGKTIVYSLANFCFGGNKNPEDKDTFIFQQEFTIGENKEIEPGKINVIPCSISSVADTNDFKPTPLEGEEAERVLKKIAKYSEGMEGAFTYPD